MKKEDSAIVRIRNEAAKGVSVRALAVSHRLSVGAIQKIVTGKTYKQVGGPIREIGTKEKSRAGSCNPNKSLTLRQVIDIRNKLNQGSPRSKLARDYQVSLSTVDKLATGKSWNLPYAIGNATTVFPDEELIRINLKEGRPDRGSEEETLLVSRVEAAFKVFGYPYRRWSSAQFDGYLERIRERAPAVDSNSVIDGGSSVGLRLLNAFHPSIDHINRKGAKSPVEVFNDPVARRGAIIDQIRYGNRLSPGGIRSALTETSGSTQISSFRPTIAYALIKHYGASSLLDPCAGWGGRMVGAIAAGISYVGIDPSAGTIAGNEGFLVELSRSITPEQPVALLNECAEDVLGSNRDIGKFDLVFTSPPYFDLEHYSTDPRQSYLRYPNLELWSREFLQVMLEGSASRLNSGGRVGINTFDKLSEVVLTAADKVGLTLVETLRIEFPSRRWQRASGNHVRSEPIFIFQRSNA